MSDFERIMERELAYARKLADEDDERMAAAARGEPFWRTGPAAEVTGVAEYLPLTMTERLDQEHALFEQAQKDYAAFRLETAKLYLDHVRAAEVTGPPAATLTERYAGCTVEITGGTIELGLQRDRGEPIGPKRNDARRICAEEALVLNGDDIDEDSAARLSDAIAARFEATWPRRAWWIEIWQADERLTQVYHRWPWPGDVR